MKRDDDLVRWLLLKAEAHKGGFDPGALCEGRWSDGEVYWHASLLIEKGLLRGECPRDADGDVMDCNIDGLTWEGCDFLEAVRSPAVWRRAKAALGTAGSCALGTVMTVAAKVAEQMAMEYLAG